MARTLFDESTLSQAFDAVGRRPMAGVLRTMAETCLFEAETVAGHIANGALIEARRMAHGIAGAAGNCSAVALEQDARAIAIGENPGAEEGAALIETARATTLWLASLLATEATD